MGCSYVKNQPTITHTLSSGSSKSMKGCNTDQTTIKGSLSNLGIHYVGSSMPGWREDNEDSFLVENLSPNLALFGVFDGHFGPEISVFAAKNFAQVLQKNSHFQEKYYEKALRQAFISVDNMLISKEGNKKLRAIQKDISLQTARRDSGNNCLLSGSTGLVVLVTEQNIFVANAGDSKGVIVNNNNKIIFQTTDHRPLNPIENQRIISRGGSIISGRIQGHLNVSRGFGDYTYKSGDKNTHLVTADPDITKIPRKDVQAMLLGSDGIFQKSTQQIWQNFVKNASAENQIQQPSLLETMECTVQKYFTTNLGKNKFDIKGTDNMTAILINFDSQFGSSTSMLD